MFQADICMKRKKTVFFLLSALGVITLLLYYSGTADSGTELSQGELVWNTEEELLILAGIENKIEQSVQGKSETIPVSSHASGYEAVCPQMLAGERQTDGMVSEEKTVYLTFDDGPSRQTGKVLDILDRYGIKASFFVVASDLTESGREALKRAAQEGHVIGMHSGTHEYKKIYSSVTTLLEDFEQVYTMIQENTGQTPSIYRFPGGSYNTVGRQCILQAIPEMERRGFVYFDWNVTAEDAVGNPTASSIKKNIFTNLDSIAQPVILMHDGPCNSLTVAVLPEIIEELIKRGYSFDTLDHRKPYCFNW